MATTISVVIPTYNRKALLADTLAAVRAQRHPAHEVIVVDDGSQDGSQELVAERFPEVRFVRIVNSGELVARNTGLRMASGTIVAFCDSDDLWLPDHLSRLAALWDLLPTVRAAFANFRLFGEDHPDRPEKFAMAPTGWLDMVRPVGDGLGVIETSFAGELVRFNPFFPSAMAVRRDDFLAQGGWDETIGRQVSLDFATTLRAAARPPIGLILEPTVLIRKHSGNFSADTQKMNLGDAFALEHALARVLELAPHAEAIRASARARRVSALELAFARRDFASVTEIKSLLADASLPASVQLKRFVAGLPPLLRDVLATLLLAAGSARARLQGR